jgi:hypothetical protein
LRQATHLFNLPLAIDGEGDNEGKDEEAAQHAGGNLGAALAGLALLPAVAAQRLVQRFVALRPVDSEQGNINKNK